MQYKNEHKRHNYMDAAIMVCKTRENKQKDWKKEKEKKKRKQKVATEIQLT